MIGAWISNTEAGAANSKLLCIYVEALSAVSKKRTLEINEMGY